MDSGIFTDADQHNQLTDLQGGTTSEYYHLTESQHEWVENEVLYKESVSSETIASGAIIMDEGAHFAALTGEGDTTDTLTYIQLGSGNAPIGYEITLKGKASLSYTITISNGTYLHLQGDFLMNNQYDTITLISIGSGHFIEKARASNG